jgi:hypothetical protein
VDLQALNKIIARFFNRASYISSYRYITLAEFKNEIKPAEHFAHNFFFAPDRRR